MCYIISMKHFAILISLTTVMHLVGAIESFALAEVSEVSVVVTPEPSHSTQLNAVPNRAPNSMPYKPSGEVGVPWEPEHLAQGRIPLQPWWDWMYKPEITGTKNYVCNTGDDLNDGLTPETAKQSFASFVETHKTLGAGDAILFCKDGYWEINKHNYLFGNGCSVDAMCTIGTYGDGDRPHIHNTGGGLEFKAGANNPVDGIYWDGLEMTGLGKDISGSEGFRIWDNVHHIVWNDMYVHDFRIGWNVSLGTAEDGLINSHFAWTNNVSTDSLHGVLAGVSDVFLDGNYFDNTGESYHSRGIYLSGLAEKKLAEYGWPVASNHIVQRNTITRNALNSEGQCSGAHYTTHGRVNGTMLIDNHFYEKQGTAGNGCWGLTVDRGRTMEWGIESFEDTVISGNKLTYLGNLHLGLSGAPGALITHNEIRMDIEGRSSGGIIIPDKTETPFATPSINVTAQYNKIWMEGTNNNNPIYTNGIHIGALDNVAETFKYEHNIVYKSEESQVCYRIADIAYQAVGTNQCLMIVNGGDKLVH